MSYPTPPPPGSAPEPGGQWQPVNPPVPQDNRSWFARHKVLSVVLGLGLVMLLCCGGAFAMMGGGDDTTSTSVGADEGATDETKDSTKSSDKKDSDSKDSDKAPGIGSKVRDGKFEFTITGVRDGGTQVGSSDFGEKAQGQFWLIDITVENIGDESQVFFDSEQKVKDEKGRQHSADTAAALYLEDNQNVWLEEINPGNTVKGSLIYDLPAGSTPAEIELHDSMFSGGVTVDLSKK